MSKPDVAVTKLFLSNRSQAVRLPKTVEFPAEVREVAIRRVGRTRIITPANAVWDDFFEAPGIDLGVRDQHEAKEREAFLSLRYMLDTDLCIRVLRDRPVHLRSRFNAEADGLAISTVVLMELLHGAAKSQRPTETRRTVEDFAARLIVLAFDARAAQHAADIKADLEREGRIIGAYDLQIAGHARSEALTLVTGNLREFQRVQGLMTEDWV